ncbi:hypothetical protein [Amycolatopsis sp. lyj-109]|uniref:hypothetical protein n=1 Tax=Amycolatopsis sp. lyj-109 TaxID=2789287 RepID=UPI00397A1270
MSREGREQAKTTEESAGLATAEAPKGLLATARTGSNTGGARVQLWLHRNHKKNTVMKASNHSPLTEEFNNLPEHFTEAFYEDLLWTLAALRLHGFSILRADESHEVDEQDDLWSELSHPSIWMQARTAPALTRRLREAKPGSAEHTRINNDLIRANLTEQRRLLDLLKGFYGQHTASSFHARLIVETIDQGESYLRPQEASVRTIASKREQKDWLKQANDELAAFGNYIAEIYKD